MSEGQEHQEHKLKFQEKQLKDQAKQIEEQQKRIAKMLEDKNNNG